MRLDEGVNVDGPHRSVRAVAMGRGQLRGGL